MHLNKKDQINDKEHYLRWAFVVQHLIRVYILRVNSHYFCDFVGDSNSAFAELHFVISMTKLDSMVETPPLSMGSAHDEQIVESRPTISGVLLDSFEWFSWFD